MVYKKPHLEKLRFKLKFLLKKWKNIPKQFFSYTDTNKFWFVSIGASIIETIKSHVPPICSISMLVLFVPQIYWFGIMVKGGLKVIYGKDDIKED